MSRTPTDTPIRYHLLGIGGTAMASLAGLLEQLGHEVQGSDGPIYPPMSDVLADLGATVFEGYDAANLDPAPDMLVVGNAIPRGNPELEAALDRDLPYASMPALLSRVLLQDRTRLVVSGTHGKTTTTAMAASLLHAAGKGAGWLVGGLPLGLPANHHIGRPGQPFVIEGDEYDTAYFDKAAKFFHYRPHRLVVGGVEFDHADIYADLDAIELQFRRLVNIVPRTGRVIACADDAAAMRVTERPHCDRLTFGVGPRKGGAPEPDFWAPETASNDGGIEFELRIRGGDRGLWRIAMPGAFNVRNALAALALTEGLGLSDDDTRAALAAFRGVRRRLELRGERRGIRVYDDFAHHPTAIAGAIEAITDVTEGRVIAVLEPRSWTLRRRVFESELAGALARAEVAVVAPVYRPEKLSQDVLMNPDRVVSMLARRGREAHAPDSTDEIVSLVLRIAEPGDSVLIMSNGGFDGIYTRLLDGLN
ncbi:MAG: UDP-N-acetylmuramate:L-alanyl-gamma-D-glutamyl-meso-diaminopimelate ligase [Gemmatimonadetes bacterium]|nr:UDP-N-acetylmuramate:L-alanyl-gamma-D-glutamyl-meso-diaminopimelate ligase [Gemmatimonadota bacterium]